LKDTKKNQQNEECFAIKHNARRGMKSEDGNSDVLQWITFLIKLISIIYDVVARRN
jgi:hypothetical protein